MGVDEGNLQVIDVEVILENCPTTIPLRYIIQVAITVFIFHIPRALSLRNLVSGYECGRVFPAGVGPGSP